MTVLLIAGSPSERSRSAALLASVGERLERRGAHVEHMHIRDLSPQALLLADVAHRSVSQALDQVARAQVIVVATPVYKAAYSGFLKVFLDLLPQAAFKDKLVLPLATGGSPHHMLALDYALRPVLQSLGARHILPGIYATEAQITLTPEGAYNVHADIALRLDEAVSAVMAAGFRAPASGFEPIHFSRVRCSV